MREQVKQTPLLGVSVIPYPYSEGKETKELKESILIEAHALVTGDRAAEYGDAKEDMERAAKGISMVVGVPVAPWQVPLIMMQIKISRLCYRRKRDSMRDVAGYAHVLSMVECEDE